jgi:hypothetical protein
MNSSRKNAELELDAKANDYMKAHQCDYRTAWQAVTAANPTRFKQYAFGDSETGLKTYSDDTLTAAQREMALLLADPGKTMTLAGFALDKLAREKLRNKNIDDPVAAYRRALSECKQDYPALARAASDGFLADTDFVTLALLIPSVAGEVERGNYRQVDRCACGELRPRCRARKLARKRGVDEDSREFERCILDAQRYGTELDAIACWY